MDWERFYSQTSGALAAKVRQAVALSSTEAARLPTTGLNGDMSVTIECYGHKTVWNSRYLAFHYYMTGAEQCDGAESDRYYTICGNLLLGYENVNDRFIAEK